MWKSFYLFILKEWPSELESLLKVKSLPNADFDCDLPTYVDLLCSFLDIPVHKSRVQSLHVLFTLYAAFKNSEHFNQFANRTNQTNIHYKDIGLEKINLANKLK